MTVFAHRETALIRGVTVGYVAAPIERHSFQDTNYLISLVKPYQL